MDAFKIQDGVRLRGEVQVSGSKNASAYHRRIAALQRQQCDTGSARPSRRARLHQVLEH